MNIAFLLKPKSRVAYLVEGSSFRQGLEKLRRYGYTAIPVISKDGRYLGCISEGDFLWNIMSMGSMETHALEQARIDDIISEDRMPPVRITADAEALVSRALEQNFVPVVDDRDMFMGIITRRAILCYCMEQGLLPGNNQVFSLEKEA
ncbi:MAG: CBS domain-containing protein [Ruminococcaceae bacterium]|nr:CBS domain-containing protein [Oscillospiraceae bacterium]